MESFLHRAEKRAGPPPSGVPATVTTLRTRESLKNALNILVRNPARFELVPDSHEKPKNFNTFCTNYKGESYVVAPNHGLKDNDRKPRGPYLHIPDTDIAVRKADPHETSHAIPFGMAEKKPAAHPIQLEGSLPTGRRVKTTAIAAAATGFLDNIGLTLESIRGNKVPNAAPLPFTSFRDVDVFVVTDDWLKKDTLGKPAIQGFSGALASTLNRNGKSIPVGQVILHREITIHGDRASKSTEANSRVTLVFMHNRSALERALEFAHKTFSKTRA